MTKQDSERTKVYANEHPRHMDDVIKSKKKIYKKTMPQGNPKIKSNMPQRTPDDQLDYHMFSEPHRMQSI